MFNFFKTDSERVRDAKFNKSKYRIVKLENGKYSFDHLSEDGGNWLKSSCSHQSDFVIEMLEDWTKREERKKSISELVREVIE